MTPEKLFDRRWALILLDRTLTRVGRDYADANKAALFDHLKGFLTGDSSGVRYAEVAKAMNMSEGAVKVAVHRLRRHFRDVLLEQIAETVSDPADIDAEIAYLMNAVSMTPPHLMACPQCGRSGVPTAATHGLSAPPACSPTAASMADDGWPYQVLAPIEQDALGITYLAERYAGSVARFRGAQGDRWMATGMPMRSRFHELKPALARLRASSRGQSARCRFGA